MNKMWLVMRHEFSGLVKSRSFIFMTLLLIVAPLVLVAIIGGITYHSLQESLELPVGYVDEAGLIEAMDNDDFVAYADEGSAKSEFMAGGIYGYYLIPEDYVESGTVYFYSAKESLLSESVAMSRELALERELVHGLTQHYLPIEVEERILEPLAVENVSLGEAGEVVVTESPLLTIFAVGFGAAFLMLVMIPGGYLLTGMMKEKSNRVMEVLLSSVPPLQLFVGKVLGLGLAGLLQIVIVVVGDLVLVGIAGTFLSTTLGDVGSSVATNGATASSLTNGGLLENIGVMFPQGLGMFIGLALIYFVIGYLMVAITSMIIATFCDVERQASQFQTIWAIFWIAPIFIAVTGDINSTATAVLSMIPLTAPVAMVMRMSVSSVPAWQVVVSVGLLLLMCVGLLWFVLRLFRSGILVSRGSFSFRGLFRRGVKEQWEA